MSASTTPAPLAKDDFRYVIGHFTTGVTVITAIEGEELYGTTASAVTSLSLDPPMLLICMNRQSATGSCVGRVGRFAVNILDERQPDLAYRFASKSPDKFDGVEVTLGCFGEPLLVGALAHLETRVVEQTAAGTHVIFVAEVERAQAGEGTPLAYYRGRFSRLHIEPDA